MSVCNQQLSFRCVPSSAHEHGLPPQDASKKPLGRWEEVKEQKIEATHDRRKRSEVNNCACEEGCYGWGTFLSTCRTVLAPGKWKLINNKCDDNTIPQLDHSQDRFFPALSAEPPTASASGAAEWGWKIISSSNTCRSIIRSRPQNACRE